LAAPAGCVLIKPGNLSQQLDHLRTGFFGLIQQANTGDLVD